MSAEAEFSHSVAGQPDGSGSGIGPPLPPSHRRAHRVPGEPTIDVALQRWDRVLEAESLLSAAQARDARLRPVPTRLSDAARRLTEALSRDAGPPRTLVTDLAGRLLGPLQRILSAPRTRLVREHALVPVHAFSRTDARTRRWYARRPGATPLEKAGSEGKLLGVVRRHSADILENRVLTRVVALLEPRVTTYLRAFGDADATHVETTRRFARMLEALRAHPLLANVSSPSGPVRPTNALLRDPAYSAVWDAYVTLSTEDERASALWRGLQRTVSDLTALTVASTLESYLPGALDAAVIIGAPSSDSLSRIRPETSWCGVWLGPATELVFAEISFAGRAEIALRARSSEKEQTWRAPAWNECGAPSEHLRAVASDVERWLEDFTGRAPGEAPRRDSVPAVAHDGPYLRDGRPLSDVRGELRTENGSGSSYHFSGWLYDSPAADVRTSAELWAACQDPLARRALIDSSAGERNPVLVVPEDLDLVGANALAGSGRRRWLLPRSVAAALGWWDARSSSDPSPERVGVICLGGLAPTTNVLERTESGGLDEWTRRRPVTTAWTPGRVEGAVVDHLMSAGVRESAIPAARARLWAALDRAELTDRIVLPVRDADGWRVVDIPAESVLTAMEPLLEHVRHSLRSHEADHWLVEGWPLRHRWIRDRILALEPSPKVEILEPEAVRRGAREFYCRISGKPALPTYVDVVPKVELEVRVGKGSDWFVVCEGGPMRPGERVEATAKGLHLPRGRGGVVLPIRVDGSVQPSVAAWQPRIELREPLDVTIRSEWRSGFGGLHVELCPVRRDAPIGRQVLALESESSARRAENVFPEPVPRNEWSASMAKSAAQHLDAALTSLRAAANDQRAANELLRAGRALYAALPAMKLAIGPDAGGELDRLAPDALGLLGVWLDKRFSGASRERVKGVRESKQLRAALDGEQFVAWRIAAGLGQRLSKDVVELAFERLAKPPKVKDLPTLVDALYSAIACYADGTTPETADQLRRLAVQNPSAQQYRELWGAQLGRALLVHPRAAGALDDPALQRLTQATIAWGESLTIHPKDTGALAILLLGLLRAREGREDRYGPTTEWSRTLTEHVDRWQSANPNINAAKTGLHLPEGQLPWPTLSTMLAGHSTRLVVSLSEGA